MNINSLMELQEARETAKSNDCPLLVQCGSPNCKLCPAFTEEVQNLALQYKFHYIYIDTHGAEEDLLEEIQVTRLPAYILETDVDVHKQQGARPKSVREVVSSVCSPVLVTDCDF